MFYDDNKTQHDIPNKNILKQPLSSPKVGGPNLVTYLDYYTRVFEAWVVRYRLSTNTKHVCLKDIEHVLIMC